MNKKVIGIDCGTSTSACAVFEGGSPVIIVNSEGKRTTPSVVSFDKDGTRVVGDAAQRQAVARPKNTVYEIKRFMGNTYKESEKEAKRVTYDVIDDNGYPRVKVEDRKFTPQEISATILQKMKKSAEDYLGEEVTDAVITVPAYFSDAQRQATKEAGEIAGLNVKRIINEPTAAALAYGLDKGDKDMNIAVFDAGGGTFDITIMNYGSGVFEVLSTNGNTHLGGSDFTERISNWIVSEFKEDNGIDVSKDAMAMQRIREAAEKAKIELSTSLNTDINLPYLSAKEGTPIHFCKSLTRAKFEQISEDLVEQHSEPCINALKSAGMNPSDIDEVILIGGTTRIPAIQKKVKEIFGKEPSKSINPDEAVALGASVQGAVLAGDDSVNGVVLLDVTPLSLGIQTLNDVFVPLIDANSTIPCSKSQIFSTAQDNQTDTDIFVYQGERKLASANKLIGQFRLSGILPAKRGIPQIEVTFDINADGILTVKAIDKATNKEQSIRIEQSSNLSKDEIERMKAEAKENEEADKKKTESAKKLNDAESIVYSAEQMVKDNKDKISDEDIKEINDGITKLKENISSKDMDSLDASKKALEEKLQKISEKLYSKVNDKDSDEKEKPKDTGTEEADYKEVKD